MMQTVTFDDHVIRACRRCHHVVQVCVGVVVGFIRASDESQTAAVIRDATYRSCIGDDVHEQDAILAAGTDGMAECERACS